MCVDSASDSGGRCPLSATEELEHRASVEIVSPLSTPLVTCDPSSMYPSISVIVPTLPPYHVKCVPTLATALPTHKASFFVVLHSQTQFVDANAHEACMYLRHCPSSYQLSSYQPWPLRHAPPTSAQVPRRQMQRCSEGCASEARNVQKLPDCPRPCLCPDGTGT